MFTSFKCSVRPFIPLRRRKVGKAVYHPACIDRQSKWIYRFPRVTVEVIEEALERYASAHFGHKRSFARKMRLSSLKTTPIFVYKLETFGEMRSRISTTRPYAGYPIEDVSNAQAPDLWEVSVQPKVLFKDAETTVDVPQTERVTRCTRCAGRGRVQCRKCSGYGAVFCDACRNNGPQMFQGDRCIYCRRWGNGGLVACCESCAGSRVLKCTVCEGHGRVMHCETLCVTWLNKVSESAQPESGVPIQKLTVAEGDVVFREEGARVESLIYPTVPFLERKSDDLLKEHRGAFPHILKQRHSIRVVPITEAVYSWKGQTGRFYLYGLENKVYFAGDHPKWCHSCNCM